MINVTHLAQSVGYTNTKLEDYIIVVGNIAIGTTHV